MTDQKIDSASDDRTANNTVRHQYTVLSDEQKAAMLWVKDSGAAFIAYCADMRSAGISPREMSLAITEMEVAVFWAVKGITA